MGGIGDNGDKPNLNLVREDMERSLDRIQSEAADKTRELEARIEELRTVSDERMAALAARVTFTEALAPKNANRRKVDEGHHHNQTLEGLDAGKLKGFGYQLDALDGITLTRSGRTLKIAATGAPGFCHDYLIDALYTGTEGATITIPNTTHTFKVYSDIKAAVDDANSNRQTNSQSTSFLICGTGKVADRYQEGTQISLNPPDNGSYHLFGTGADTTQIEGTMTSGDLFNIPTQVGDSVVEFHHIEMTTDKSIDLINGGGSTRITLDNCLLRPNDSSANAIKTGNGGAGWNISNTNFEGTGTGIAGGGAALMHVRLTNCYVAMTTGINLTNDLGVYCTNVRFACSTRDVVIGATAGAQFFSAGNCEFNKGIKWTGGASATLFDNFLISGCTFTLGSGETGIDYSGVTGADALIGAEAHSLVGNTFRGAGTAKGIVGGSSSANGPHCVTVMGNSFEGFTSGNEIIDMDLTGDNEVVHNCTDSGATLESTATGHPHAILDGLVHNDSVADTVTRGSIIVANSTPKWDEKVLGADHLFLGSDGSDAVYRNVGWDAILSGGDDIEAALTAGARRILLLSGTYTPANTIGIDNINVEIHGAVRDDVIIDMGGSNFFAFTVGPTAGVWKLVGMTFINAGTTGGGVNVRQGTAIVEDCVADTDCPKLASVGATIGGAALIVRGGQANGVPPSASGQIALASRVALAEITGVAFGGAGGAGASIYVNDTGGLESQIAIANCTGDCLNTRGWLDLGGSTGDTDSVISVTGNVIEVAQGVPGIDAQFAKGTITSNTFTTRTTSGSAALLRIRSDASLICTNNYLDGNPRTDVISVETANHVIDTNLIQRSGTNAIRLLGTSADNCRVSGNVMVNQTLLIDSTSTGNSVTGNIVNTLTDNAAAGLNDVAHNITGVT